MDYDCINFTINHVAPIYGCWCSRVDQKCLKFVRIYTFKRYGEKSCMNLGFQIIKFAYILLLVFYENFHLLLLFFCDYIYLYVIGTLFFPKKFLVTYENISYRTTWTTDWQLVHPQYLEFLRVEP